MSDSIDEHDLEVLAGIRSLYEVADPVPADLNERLKFALTVQALHAEVAELVQTPLVASRSVEELDDAELAQTITFTSGSLSLMVSLADATVDSVTVDGWVTRGGAGIELQVGNHIFEATADANGRFVLDAIPRGPGHFVIWPNPDSSDAPVVTPTIEL